MSAGKIEQWMRTVAVRLVLFAVACFFLGYLS
jgi:hypothetical protein